jgi:hypothetical protein
MDPDPYNWINEWDDFLQIIKQNYAESKLIWNEECRNELIKYLDLKFDEFDEVNYSKILEKIDKEEKENNLNKINNTSLNNLANDNSSNKIYTKPKHTLLKSFQKNESTINKESIERLQTISGSYLMPTNNNYQNILINNNNFDKLLLYNFTDRTNHFDNNATLYNSINSDIFRQGDFFNLMKHQHEHENIFNNNNLNFNLDLNKEVVFKKKI